MANVSFVIWTVRLEQLDADARLNGSGQTVPNAYIPTTILWRLDNEQFGARICGKRRFWFWRTMYVTMYVTDEA